MALRTLAIAVVIASVGLGFARAAADPPRPHDPSAVPSRHRSASFAATPPGPSRHRSAAARGAPFIRSLATRITTGYRATVLALPRVGRFKVACGADRRSRLTFRAAFLLPTSDVVVSSPGGAFGATIQPSRSLARPAAEVIAETWQIAPFASGGVRVATVHVTARPVPGGCAASAMAIVGPDQGHTRTGEG